MTLLLISHDKAKKSPTNVWMKLPAASRVLFLFPFNELLHPVGKQPDSSARKFSLLAVLTKYNLLLQRKNVDVDTICCIKNSTIPGSFLYLEGWWFVSQFVCPSVASLVKVDNLMLFSCSCIWGFCIKKNVWKTEFMTKSYNTPFHLLYLFGEFGFDYCFEFLIQIRMIHLSDDEHIVVFEKFNKTWFMN